MAKEATKWEPKNKRQNKRQRHHGANQKGEGTFPGPQCAKDHVPDMKVIMKSISAPKPTWHSSCPKSERWHTNNQNKAVGPMETA
jgi:hypothetical protein